MAPDPGRVNIRRLTPADASAYRALMLEAYAQHPAAFTSSAEERGALPLQWWESRLDAAPDASTVVLGAFQGSHLAGAAGIEFETRTKARHKSTLFGMMVPEAARGVGIGQALVEATLALARARDGVLLVNLTVSEGNTRAQALYERCGFVTFGVEPLAIAVGTTFVAKVHMWCDLRRPGARAVGA
jgi:ribosomal protein S18 acetylase RimI-like enzyme